MALLNFNARYYKPMQPDEVLTDYSVWLEICARMDAEVADAKLEWRNSVRKRDELLAVLKEQSDSARFHYIELEKRQKPPAPRKTK